MSLTWSPPSFHSDDIPQDSITTYHVHIEGQDGFVVADVNTANTSYGLTCNLIVICNSYNISVIAFIEQYSSPATTIIKETTGSKIISIILLLINTFYINYSFEANNLLL